MEFRILTVALLYILEVLCFIKKKFKGNLKHNFHSHDYNARGNIGLETKSCDTALLQKSVANMGAKLYSRLPDRIKTLNYFESLKKM
jgi:hypothetical protein